jgi:hypothetical protein
MPTNWSDRALTLVAGGFLVGVFVYLQFTIWSGLLGPGS